MKQWQQLDFAMNFRNPICKLHNLTWIPQDKNMAPSDYKNATSKITTGLDSCKSPFLESSFFPSIFNDLSLANNIST